MKKTQTFSRYIFLILLVLESLTLMVVVGVLHAMWVKSIDRQYQNHIDAHLVGIRLFLRDRHEYARARLDDLSTNNGIKVALLLGLQDKATEVVTSLYPPANGVTYYIRTLSGSLIPKPSEAHQFLVNTGREGVANLSVNTEGADTTMTVFTRSIVRSGKPVGQAIGVYDLVDDRNLYKLQKTFFHCRLLRVTAERLHDIHDGHSIRLNSDQKQNLGSHTSPLLISDMLIMPLKGFRHVYFASDTQSLGAKKRKFLRNILLLCIPLLGLALAASYMILQKVTLPLNALAEDARQITNGACAHYLDVKKIKHVEFLDLTKAFNNALTHINQRNEQLLQLNQSLQNEIFERKQLGDAFAASEKQLRSLQDNIPVGLFRTTPDGRIIYANPACLNIFGHDNIAEFQAVDANGLYENKADRKKMLDELNAIGSLERWQVRMRRKDGSLFWALLYINKIAYSKETYLDGIIQDISMQVKAGPHIQLTIADTGHGISHEILSRIFDPYYTTKKPGEGTGIGLSVVQGIVRSHDGFVTVDSKPEQGTCFMVFLPIIVSEKTPQTMSSTQIVGGNERLLFVDDEQLVQQMGHQMLERLGYQVTSRSSSLEALELFERAPDQFDLVITDMTMPDLTGDQLAKRISDIRPDLPIILLTGYSNRLDHKNIAEAGVQAILYKPLVKNDLASAIRDVIISNGASVTPAVDKIRDLSPMRI
jgi:PAS domain S-box-containing protein